MAYLSVLHLPFLTFEGEEPYISLHTFQGPVSSKWSQHISHLVFESLLCGQKWKLNIARCIKKHQEQKTDSPKSTPLVDHSSSLIRDRDSLGSWKRSLVLRLGKWRGICPSKRHCIEIQRWRKVSQWTQLFGKVGGWYGISLNGGPRSKAGSWLIRMASPLPGGTKLLCNEAGQVVDRASHYVHIDLTSNDTNTSHFVTDFVESCPC